MARVFCLWRWEARRADQVDGCGNAAQFKILTGA
jgi:hypothetical protein